MAAEVAKSLEDNGPDDSNRTSLSARGQELLKQSHFEEALQYLEMALEMSAAKETPNDREEQEQLNIERSKLLYCIAEAQYGLGEMDKAIEYYDAACELHPHGDHQTYFDRGYCHSKLRNHELAIEDFSKSIELKSDMAWSYFHRGWNHYYMHRLDEAIQDFQSALEIESRFDDDEDSTHDMKEWLIEALAAKAKRCVKEKKFVEALNAIESSLSRQTDGNWTLKHLLVKASILLELKRYEDAIETYSIARDVDPRDISCLINRAYALYKLQHFDSALEDYHEALTLDPKAENALTGIERTAVAKRKYLEKMISDSVQKSEKSSEDSFKPMQVAG